MSFSGDLDKFAKKAVRETTAAKRAVVLELLKSVVLKSPVGDPSIWLYKHPTRGYVNYLDYREVPKGYVGGTFRGNWQVSLNVPTSTQLEVTDKSGANTIKKGREALKKYDGDETAYIVNNMPYSERLEYGWSSQAPEGMVRTTVLEFQQIVRNVTISQVKK